MSKGTKFERRSAPVWVVTLWLGCSVQAAIAQEADNAQLLWTTKPVRVQQTEQNLKRLPSKRETSDFPDVMYVRKSVRVTDSVTFQTRTGTFRLAGVDPVPAQQVCKDITGRRWSCGLHSRMNLRGLIAGKQIACKSVSQAENDIHTVDCVLQSGGSITENLLRSGSVLTQAAGTSELAAAEDFAIEMRAGIWSDEDFFQNSNKR